MLFFSLLSALTLVSPPGRDASERLRELVLANPEITETALVRSVSCDELTCKITFQTKEEDGTKFQLAVFRFLQANPDYGSDFILEDGSDPRMAVFIMIKEVTK